MRRSERDRLELSWEVGGGGGPRQREIVGDRAESNDGNGAADTGRDHPGAGRAGSRYLRLWFTCSGVYGRAYLNASGTGYQARCPKCGKEVRFRIGPGGTSDRFFEVRCG